VDVKVIVDFNKKIRETEDGEKKNEMVSKLTPQCQSVKMVEIKTKGLAGEEAKTQKSDIPLQKNPWQIVAPLSQGSGTKSDSPLTKITILSPTQNSSWNIGSNLNIQWKALPLPKAFHVFLFSKPNDTMAEAIISQFKTFKPNQQGIFSETWKIPSYIKSGGYVVKIIYVDDPSEWTTSDFFKIEGGGPSLISPKPLYTGPPVKGFKVDYPDKTDLWIVGESHNIVWSYLPSVLNDAKAYEDMTDNVRIVLKDGSGAQRLIISQSAKNKKPIYPEGMTPPNTTSSSMWTIPKDLTDGKYVIRIETSDGHFYGESEAFTIWSPKVVKMEPAKKTIQKDFPSSDPVKKFFEAPKGDPVQVTFKLVSVTPHLSPTTHEIYWIDFTAEIDANTEFKFGDYSTKDPILGNVLVKPEMLVELRWVDPGTSIYYGGYFAFEYFGYLGDTKWIYPTGIMKKGKNIVKFIITGSVFNKPNLGALRVNGTKAYWEGKTQIIKTCKVDWDLYGKVVLWLFTKSSPPPQDGKSIGFFIREPRKEIWVQGQPTYGDCK
jgi:hypothetical protein